MINHLSAQKSKNLKYYALCVTLIFIFTVVYAPFSVNEVRAALLDNLQGCWDLDAASGTRVDESTNGNDLTDTNSVGQGASIVSGNSADLERSTGHWLGITDASQTGLDFTGDMSFNIWVNFESVPASGGQWNFISKFLTTGNNRSYLFYANESAGTIYIHFYETSNGLNAVDTSVSWAPSTATNYMLTVVYDASAGSVAYYVNGSQQGTTQTGHHTSVKNGTAPFELGDVGQYGTLGHDGLMDVAIVFDRTLTTGDISDLYNSGSGTDCNTIVNGGGTPPAPSSIIMFQ